MSPVLKRGLHWAGSTLAIVGISFIALRLRDFIAEIDFTRFGIIEWSTMAGLALVYGLSNLMLALAWWNLLGQFGVSSSRRCAVKVYGISQIAKYVPGNVFHLAGRQAMGMAAGMAGWALARSAVWELGLIVTAGGLFGSLVLPLVLPGLPADVGPLGFVAMLGAVTTLLWYFIGSSVVRAFVWYVAFLLVSGLLFVGLVEFLVEGSATEAGGLTLIGAYVLAWLVGLVTPGAPAGVGVRELVLLFLLKGLVSEADLLLAVMLGRMVTVAGDLAFFGFARMLNAKVLNAVV
jgi:glycosyltransferase 2 family protein